MTSAERAARLMALRGGLNPRDMTKDLKRALGIGRLGNDWKGR